MKKVVGILLCLALLAGSVLSGADGVSGIPVDASHFPDENFRSYVANRYGTELYESTISMADQMYPMNLGIKDLTGHELFTELEILDCEQNQITSLSMESHPRLTCLTCSENQLTAIDVSENPDLQELYCWRNQLSELDLSNNTDLRTLDCRENNLSALDVSAQTQLTCLSCQQNGFTALDVTNSPALEQLYCAPNDLETLKLGNKPALYIMDCSNNRLKTLDITRCTSLRLLYCAGNRFSSLDVSGCEALNRLVKEKEPNEWEGIRYWGADDDGNGYDDRCLSVDATVTVITDEGTYGGSDPVPVTSVKLNKTKAALVRKAGELKPTLQLSAVVGPEDATDKTVTWKSSNKKVATVDQNGLVTALKAGKATITCTAADGSKVKATCKLTVTDEPVAKLSLNKSKAVLTRKAKVKKPTLQLKVTVTPEDAVDQTVVWKSSDTKVAVVDKNGKVTGLKPGTATITCSAQDGSGVSASCKVTVQNRLLKKLTLNKTKAVLKKAGATLRLSVKSFKPVDAFSHSVTWKSSDEKVATVDKNGRVTAVGKGTCVITCTAADGSKVKATCKITVKK